METNLSKTSRSPQEGLALFVVLVVVVVLTVVVFQLSHMTKVEERISKNKQGLVEIRLSLTSAVRMVLVRLIDDWVLDQEDAAVDSTTGTGAGAGVGDPAGGPPAGGDVPDIGDIAGDGIADPASTEPQPKGTDSIQEKWKGPYTENLNEMEVTVQLLDSESMICLAYPVFFNYVKIPEEEVDPGDGLAGDDIGDPPTGDDSVGDDAESDTEEDEFDDEEPELNRPEIVEYEEPDPEKIDLTKEMLSRLIQGIIAYNQEFEFEYEETPNSDGAAEQIVEWILDRWEDDRTRVLQTVEIVKNLSEVSWELWNGPKLPEDYEDDVEDDDDDGFSNLINSGQLGEFGSLLEGGGLGQQGNGFVEVEGGVEPIPRPLGLKHVLTARSTGKINLNTASAEVLAALMMSVDLDEALLLATEIEVFRNTYVEEDDSNGTVAGNDPDPALEDSESAEPQFNIFTTFEDLKKVNEEWEDSSAVEDGIFETLTKDLQHLSVYRSTFFKAIVLAEREDQVVEGVLVVERLADKINVISWRETAR